MKKSRILISSVFLASAIAASLAAAGCSHKHTYSEDWTTDETNHWHAATCKHTDEKADLDTHKYDANYKCTVCDYKHEHTFNSNYECSCGYVLADQGIVIVKGTTEYTLDSSLTMNVPMNDFAVKVRKENGMDAGDIQYTLKYYKGAEEINNLNRVTEGAYNVWATATLNGKEVETFVVIYVLDEIESIAFKSGTVEQEAGENTMSKTWKYTVTYKSGRQEEVGAEDVKVDGLVTTAVTDEGNATVSYTYKNLKGKETTVQVEVPYTVKEASGVKVNTVVFSADNLAITGDTTADTVLVEGVMTAKPNVAVDANKKDYEDANDSSNNRSYTQRLKLGGTGSPTSRSVEIITTGKAKIVVYAQSSSSGSDRQLALAKDTFVSWAGTPEEIVGETKTCLGASLTRVEYEVEEAGTYYLLSTSGGINIYGIEITSEAVATEIKTTAFSADTMTIGDIKAKTELVSGISVTASDSATVVVDANKKTYEDANDSSNNRSYTQRLKLGGEGKKESRSVEIVTAGKAKIVIYAMSSSGSETREVALYDSTFVDKTATPDAIIGTTQECPGDKLYRLEWEVDAAGTYYIACLAKGLNIYGIEVSAEVAGSGSSSTATNVVIGSEQLTAGEITEKTEIATGVSVIPAPEGTEAGKGVVVDTNSKSYAEDGKNFTLRIKLAGTGDATKRCIEIVTSGKAKIVVYAMSSSSGADRDLGLSDGTTELAAKTCLGASLTKVEYEVDAAGTFYLYSKDSGINIYGIDIIYS